jgi:hypothetical protein
MELACREVRVSDERARGGNNGNAKHHTKREKFSSMSSDIKEEKKKTIRT